MDSTKKMESGTFIFGCPPYGYTKDENGNLVIEPAEAEIVRMIFTSVLNGMGTYKIAQILDKKKIPTRKRGKWSGSTVKGILINEKYYGAAVFQKHIPTATSNGTSIMVNWIVS